MAGKKNTPPPAPPGAIRPLYEAYGAEGYYRIHAGSYSNPHFPEIEALVQRNLSRIDTSAVLDFAAGGGEVTRILQHSGCENVTGCDPFTYDLYEQNTGMSCLRWSFKDLIKGADIGQYTCIICSFALHLCPEKDLYPLCMRLFEAAPLLVVITPHKRPELERLSGIRLSFDDAVLTAREKKVRWKEYTHKNIK